MKCQGCKKQISEHARFYVFEIIDYYPSGGTGDLKMIVNNLDSIPGDGLCVYEGIYACGNKIYCARTGKEIQP